MEIRVLKKSALFCRFPFYNFSRGNFFSIEAIGTMACSFSKSMNDCGANPMDKSVNPNVLCIPLMSCDADISGHMKQLHLGGISNEVELILTRAGLFDLTKEEIDGRTICPRHRAQLGNRWRQTTRTCCIPNTLSTHKETRRPKGERPVNASNSKKILQITGELVAPGSRKIHLKFHN